MFSINLYIQNIHKPLTKKELLEKEAYYKRNIVAKLKLSHKYRHDKTKRYFIEKEIIVLTNKLDNLYILNSKS